MITVAVSPFSEVSESILSLMVSTSENRGAGVPRLIIFDEVAGIANGINNYETETSLRSYLQGFNIVNFTHFLRNGL